MVASSSSPNTAFRPPQRDLQVLEIGGEAVAVAAIIIVRQQSVDHEPQHIIVRTTLGIIILLFVIFVDTIAVDTSIAATAPPDP